jgi:hypothetical protein
MLAHGKYYQPDHWNSYQFRDGQALKPILGIRHSDAIAFCEWLTKLEIKNWHYRLPTEIESKNNLKPSQDTLPYGYWIVDHRERTRFVWQRPSSNVVIKRIVDSSTNFGKELDIDLLLSQIQSIKTRSLRRLEWALSRSIDRGIGRDLAKAVRLLHNCEQELPFNIWSELGILQYRIAGRSPAKERVK